MRITPSYAPWANGGNERNHYTCDRTVFKLREEDPKISLEDAVHKACFWKNAEIKKSWFSSQQLIYGNISSEEPCVFLKLLMKLSSDIKWQERQQEKPIIVPGLKGCSKLEFQITLIDFIKEETKSLSICIYFKWVKKQSNR